MRLAEMGFQDRYLCDAWTSTQFPGEEFRLLFMSEASESEDCLCAIYSHGLVVLGPDSGDEDKFVPCASLEAKKYIETLILLGEL